VDYWSAPPKAKVLFELQCSLVSLMEGLPEKEKDDLIKMMDVQESAENAADEMIDVIEDELSKHSKRLVKKYSNELRQTIQDFFKNHK
jgi:gas vesicle protein